MPVQVISLYGCLAGVLEDDLIRITLIWSSVSVFWEATSVAIVAVFNQYVTLPLGYIAVALMMTYGRDVAINALRQTSNANYMVTIEVIYVAISSIFGIMLWKGQHCRCKVESRAKPNV